jgi:GT2 family glycosyltransferase
VQLGMGESDFGQFEGIIQRDWSPGMGTLIPRHVLEKTNSYDFKNMPQYLADVDLCLRAKRLGHPLYITSNSKLYNHVENTGGLSKQGRLSWSQIKFIFTSFRSGEYLRARITFIWRHSPIYLVLPSLIVRYFRLLVYILRP